VLCPTDRTDESNFLKRALLRGQRPTHTTKPNKIGPSYVHIRSMVENIPASEVERRRKALVSRFDSRELNQPNGHVPTQGGPQ